MDETNQLHDLQINIRLTAAKMRFTQSILEHSVVTYARDSKKEDKPVKPVFVQANSNSGQGHVLHYITSLACQDFISVDILNSASRILQC